ncbi:SusD/RagB family nutrient-binding outer membrane lipoprotein [Pinibacter soli]|uniref:SusD/RagB family nutrient-binding outer membrane lipoprotein n=1 Tax=Pinibacter soli TaxID=3044211 RepID=A0ABT6R780_9BACT|nr:SusD/RagB family nutrient-binding outer membrane lipoprotein [Pinibacter soli]MDI3318427.1 SusD/RagB family nutrient-binding outer membrane lipoprotein [Pinibacter soli]
MKKYLIIFASMVSLAACTKNIDSYNDQTKAASSAPPATLFSNAVRNLADVLTSSSVNTNIFRLTEQHWTTTTYTDEPNYDVYTRNIPQTWWTNLYRDVLSDLKECKRLLPGSTGATAGTKTNQNAMADIMMVYTYSVLVNTFGNVPYTKALDYDNLFPAYDDAKTIYDDLFTRLDADIAALNTAEKGFDASQDIVYGGSVSAWIKFANSLKIRMAMTVADVNAAKAKSAVEAADTKAFGSAVDNAVFKYYAITPNNNPIWTDLVQSKRQDFIAANLLIDKLNSLSDPRLSNYFKPNDNKIYVGGVPGATNTFSLFAKANDKITAMDFPGMLMDYVEIEFYRAEAIERGFTVAGTAAQHYNNAITASILYWGGTTADATVYLAQPSVAYATATGTWRQKIGTQKWIALYNRGYETWTERRRLDFPVLPVPAAPKGDYPNRFAYPTNEQTLNNQHYAEAAKAIGGDKASTKVFWDVN